MRGPSGRRKEISQVWISLIYVDVSGMRRRQGEVIKVHQVCLGGRVKGRRGRGVSQMCVYILDSCFMFVCLFVYICLCVYT